MTEVPQCQRIVDQYGTQIREVVSTQLTEGREAIFFMYRDGRTSNVFKGERTHISLSKQEERRITEQGEVVGSVHTHPQRLELSTIDIMTGLSTAQKSMCVATPIVSSDVDGDFVLTCLNLSDLSSSERTRMQRAMRRSSVGITDVGREVRKQTALDRFSIKGCRTHSTDLDGLEYPLTDRPSRFQLQIGRMSPEADVRGDIELYELDDMS